jgi:hypothetical protein
MKWILPVMIAILAVFANGDVTAQGNPAPPCRAGTLDLRAKEKGGKAQSLQDTNSDTCAYLYNEGESLSQFYYWQESYDTLKLAIERCPNFDWPDQASAFGGLDGDVANLGNGNYSYDSTIYASYRVWLYSVLYLNTTDPGYFCFCVQQIFNCFDYVKDVTVDTIGFSYGNTEVAFDRWLIQNSSCDSADAWANWQITRNEQRQFWLQDSMDGLHYPYDTTIPTLSQIGYGIDTLLANLGELMLRKQCINAVANLR